jgi:hypothetical protein
MCAYGDDWTAKSKEQAKFAQVSFLSWILAIIKQISKFTAPHAAQQSDTAQ